MDPTQKLEILDHCADVEDIIPNFSVTRLLEALGMMVEIGNTYLKEGSLEAYVVSEICDVVQKTEFRAIFRHTAIGRKSHDLSWC